LTAHYTYIRENCELVLLSGKSEPWARLYSCSSQRLDAGQTALWCQCQTKRITFSRETFQGSHHKRWLWLDYYQCSRASIDRSGWECPALAHWAVSPRT